MTAPVACPKGWHAMYEGSPRCTPCRAGRYADEVNTVECKLSEVGKFVAVHGKEAPVDCPPGTWQDQTGMAHCIPCERGRSSHLTARSERCLEAPRGYECPEKGMLQPRPCATGHYTNATRTERCQRCLPGWHAPYQGSATCYRCPLGKHSSKVIDAFYPAEHHDATGASSCTECQAGQYSPETGLAQCYACKPGRHSTLAGMTKCMQCLAGKYQPAFGATACLNCAVGSYTALRGESSCRPCEAGWTSTEGSQVCHLPEGGQINPQTGKDLENSRKFT